MEKGSGGGGASSPVAIWTAVGYWKCGASTESDSESLSKRGRMVLSSKSLWWETAAMESPSDDATMDPVTDAAAPESASSSVAGEPRCIGESGGEELPRCIGVILLTWASFGGVANTGEPDEEVDRADWHHPSMGEGR
jgi:hypothetical protein